MKELLRDAAYRRVWLVGACAGMMRWLDQLAVGIYVFEVTRSPLLVAIITLCRLMPMLAGAFIARPATMGKALPLLFGVIGSLALHDTAQADFTAFLNAMLGQILGVVVAARVTGLMRSVGAGWLCANGSTR